jgi:hypothetical protein
MGFENLKATFSKHHMHILTISRKVGFSRRCSDADRELLIPARHDDLLAFSTDEAASCGAATS